MLFIVIASLLLYSRVMNNKSTENRQVKQIESQYSVSNDQLAEAYNDVSSHVTVTFDANGGQVSTSSKEVKRGSTYGNLPTPTRTGYKFKGWNGKNMLNLEVEESVPSDIGSANTRKRIFVPNTYVKGLADNNYYSPERIYESRLNNNSIYLQAGAGYGIGFILHTGENLIYTLSYDLEVSENSRYGSYAVYYDAEGNFLGKDGEDLINNCHYYTNYTTRNNSYYLVIDFTGSTKGNGVTFSNIQLEEGPEATGYEPYFVTSSTKVTQTKDHTLTAIWEEE